MTPVQETLVSILGISHLQRAPVFVTYEGGDPGALEQLRELSYNLNRRFHTRTPVRLTPVCLCGGLRERADDNRCSCGLSKIQTQLRRLIHSTIGGALIRHVSHEDVQAFEPGWDSTDALCRKLSAARTDGRRYVYEEANKFKQFFYATHTTSAPQWIIDCAGWASTWHDCDFSTGLSMAYRMSIYTHWAVQKYIPNYGDVIAKNNNHRRPYAQATQRHWHGQAYHKKVYLD